MRRLSLAGPGEPLVARALSVVSDTSDASELIETLRSERDVILYDRAGVVRGATGMPRCVPRRRAGLWANDSRAQGLAQGFLDAPLQRRDTSCLQAIPPIDFVTEVKGIAR